MAKQPAPEPRPASRPGRVEVRISGFGGQGIIFLAYALGKAVAIQEGRHATLNQSFGPEARGSACSAQVIVADEPVDYPYIRQPAILVALSQDACRMYEPELAPGGTLLIDKDLVHPDNTADVQVLAVPATRIAEQLGRRIVANMVMLGFLAATTRLVGRDAVREAVRSSVPSGTEDLNLNAFDQGYAYGEDVLRGEPAGAAAGEEATAGGRTG